MTRGDIRLRTPIDPAFSQLWIVDLGTTKQLEAGEPASCDDSAAASPWTGEVGVMSDGQGSTDQRFAGIAKSDSSEVTLTAGEVTLWMPLPGIIYQAKAETAADADTAAEVKALVGKRVVFTLSGVKWSVAAGDADAKKNCVTIVGGNYRTTEIFFVYAVKGTYLNFCISS